jgi:hypothetical protein
VLKAVFRRCRSQIPAPQAVPDQFNERGFARASGPDDHIQAGAQFQIQAIEEAIFNLYPFDMHGHRLSSVRQKHILRHHRGKVLGDFQNHAG